jgi:hypothetical protein
MSVKRITSTDHARPLRLSDRRSLVRLVCGYFDYESSALILEELL